MSLSGLRRCAVCGACYVGVNQREYGCSSHRGGGACYNAVRLRRDAAETILLDPIRKELLAPERAEAKRRELVEHWNFALRRTATRRRNSW
jgi:hypothetical protein